MLSHTKNCVQYSNFPRLKDDLNLAFKSALTHIIQFKRYFVHTTQWSKSNIFCFLLSRIDQNGPKSNENCPERSKNCSNCYKSDPKRFYNNLRPLCWTQKKFASNWCYKKCQVLWTNWAFSAHSALNSTDFCFKSQDFDDGARVHLRNRFACTFYTFQPFTDFIIGPFFGLAGKQGKILSMVHPNVAFHKRSLKIPYEFSKREATKEENGSFKVVPA